MVHTSVESVGAVGVIEADCLESAVIRFIEIHRVGFLLTGASHGALIEVRGLEWPDV
jgi:hypothetical protein